MRVGQIGCGYWGKNLLRVLLQTDGVEVVVVADGATAARDYVKARYPEVSVIATDEDVYEDPSVGAVVIATPATDHYRAARRSLLAGKHTFVEKPLAMTAGEAQELVDLADARSLVLMAGHTFLYNSVVRRVKALIDSGELGEIYYIYSRRLNLGIVRQDVNVLWNLAPHDISIILYWMGAEPDSVTATGGTFLQPGIEDVAFVNLSFPSGASAHIHLSWLDPHKVRTMTVVASKKMVVFDDVSSDAKLTIYDMGIQMAPDPRSAASFESFGQFQASHRYGDTVIPRINYPEPLAEEIKHFVECVATGSESLSGGQHAISVVRVLEMAQASLRAGDSPDHRLGTPYAHNEHIDRQGASHQE